MVTVLHFLSQQDLLLIINIFFLKKSFLGFGSFGNRKYSSIRSVLTGCISVLLDQLQFLRGDTRDRIWGVFAYKAHGLLLRL